MPTHRYCSILLTDCPSISRKPWSRDDANVFLVNDLQDPLQKSLSSLELPRAVPGSNGTALHSSISSSFSNETPGRLNDATVDGKSTTTEYNGKQKQKFNDPARDISIQVLEKFSLVTKFARETTSQLFRESHHDSSNSYERKHWMNSGSINMASIEPTIKQKVSDENPATLDSLQVGKLSLVWGKPRQSPLNYVEWATFLDSEGRVKDSEALRKRIFYGGVENNLRKEVWRILLGYHAYDSTYAEREYLASVKKSEYDVIKSQWQSISPAQAKRFTKFRERRGLIEKDVVRTDRSFTYYDGDDNQNVTLLHDILLTYSFYNFDLGYCQGMSDLLSPILFVMEDESEAFWSFVALMERLGPNFNRDQNGMHSQLFALSKVMYLWEVFWTHYLSEHFHLYVCVAILKRYSRKIIGEQMDFDTLLKFINELSGHIDLDGIIRDAEALCVCAGENGEACIPPGTPPSLPIEAESMYLPQDDDL
ncbi:hypothetical protein QJS04_geneDACA006420 [Acorus gramineus]|uniref:Rab-GAP TBC domain-containing protein n=1 Tax=Acorus gramineus TaxID=55184 RepID=A0AAV9B080_ACOGR|nr:hypothetical protein QJS04_geneDACA006420 [Acorus gramineus]